METNETLKIALVQRAEEEIEKMVEQLQTLKEGDLKELEQVILRSSLSIGKGMIEQVLTYAQNEQRQPTRRQGSCGHRQRLVANRSKQVLTMFGRITLERQYYQCLLTSEEKNAGVCTHGEAPYFLTNAERMRYPRFRAQGMHIGSGIAEAACKTVVSTRTKRSGMRWAPAGLDAVLALRTAVLNRSYEDFWQSRGHRCA